MPIFRPCDRARNPGPPFNCVARPSGRGQRFQVDALGTVEDGVARGLPDGVELGEEDGVELGV